ncbi:MAG TPA: hypothetical protein VGG64_15905, partial [Pirellulales bacterium]
MAALRTDLSPELIPGRSGAANSYGGLCVPHTVLRRQVEATIVGLSRADERLPEPADEGEPVHFRPTKERCPFAANRFRGR